MMIYDSHNFNEICLRKAYFYAYVHLGNTACRKVNLFPHYDDDDDDDDDDLC
jgi:hypothetical protein